MVTDGLLPRKQRGHHHADSSCGGAAHRDGDDDGLVDCTTPGLQQIFEQL